MLARFRPGPGTTAEQNRPLCGPCREACRRSPSVTWHGWEIWLARQDWVFLAAAAESDCRLVIWLAPVRLIMGFRRGVPQNGPGCRTAGSYLPLRGWLPCPAGLSR